MLKNKIKKMRAKEEGFTLVELLSVVLIVGVLATLAVLALTGNIGTTRDSVAQDQLRAALVQARLSQSNNSNPAQFPAAATLISDMKKAGLPVAASAAASVTVEDQIVVLSTPSLPGDSLTMGYKPKDGTVKYVKVTATDTSYASTT